MADRPPLWSLLADVDDLRLVTTVLRATDAIASGLQRR